MKKLLTIFLAAASTVAVAQKAHLSKSIDDDGTTMSIRVTGTINGKEVDYAKTFDVSDMTREERAALRDEVFASLGAGKLEAPAAPSAPSAPAAPSAPPSPPAPSAVMVYSSASPEAGVFYSDGTDSKTDPETTGEKGYSKQVKYDSATGEMFLRYRFIRNNEEFIFEKTADVAGKTEAQRRNIIEKFETEIGLPGKGIEM
jgi:hypothetical protein